MDPITSAIVAALSAGAISGITDTAKAAVNDGYNKLKGLLTKKHGDDSDVVQAIAQLEAKPESQGRKEMLQEEIMAVKAEQDEEIVAAAKQILIQMKPQQAGMGKFTIQNNGAVQGQNIGDYQHITQHFGKLPEAESQRVERAGKHGRAKDQ
ncbi:MAG TPA: hypothetical protein VGL94_17080 [Ktedonobacteraceae bacterium]